MSEPTPAVIECCDFPGCDQPAEVLLANDEPFTSNDYRERWVCRWHRGNAFGEDR